MIKLLPHILQRGGRLGSLRRLKQAVQHVVCVGGHDRIVAHRFCRLSKRFIFFVLFRSQVQGNNPVEDLKLLFGTVGSLMRGQAIAPPDVAISNPVESLKRL